MRILTSKKLRHLLLVFEGEDDLADASVAKPKIGVLQRSIDGGGTDNAEPTVRNAPDSSITALRNDFLLFRSPLDS